MEITIASREDDDRVRALFVEYLSWADDENAKHWGRMLDDVEAYVEQEIAGLDQYMPPDGRLLLAMDGDQVMGCACLKRMAEGIGEIKRMYVRPAFRRRGVGRAMLDRLLAEVDALGYRTLRLDSTNFMTGAHALYRSVGFRERDPYEGSEIPAELQQYWVFMERQAE